jgi:hypothetical protein
MGAERLLPALSLAVISGLLASGVVVSILKTRDARSPRRAS